MGMVCETESTESTLSLIESESGIGTGVYVGVVHLTLLVVLPRMSLCFVCPNSKRYLHTHHT